MFNNLQNIAGCSILTFVGVAGYQLSDRLTDRHITLMIFVGGALAFAMIAGFAIGIGISLAGGRTRRTSSEPRSGYGQATYHQPAPVGYIAPQQQNLGSFTLKDAGWV